LETIDPITGMIADGIGMITPLRRRALDQKGRAHLCEAIMTHEEILRERVAKLEVQMDHLSAKLDDMHQKVEEMHAILLRWVIIGVAGIAGLASGLIAKLTPWSGAWLR
jgi:hypothetical protein